MNAFVELPQVSAPVAMRQASPDLSGLSRVQIHWLQTSHTFNQFICRLRQIRERELEARKAYTRLLHMQMDRKRNRI